MRSLQVSWQWQAHAQCTVIIVHQWENLIPSIDEFRLTMAGKPSLSLLVNLGTFCRCSALKSLTMLDATQKNSFAGRRGSRVEYQDSELKP